MNNAATGPKQDDDAPKAPHARRRLWLWFVTGFVVVFVGMLFGITIYSMDRSGVAATPLWQYYVIELRNGGWFLSKSLGTASGSSSAAITTPLQHVLWSSIGGAVMAGIGWAVRRFQARKRNTI